MERRTTKPPGAASAARYLPAAWLLAAWLMLIGSPSTVSAAEPTWNVVFLAVDDLGNVLGRTRPTGLKTPHLDRLVERGTFFERAYCQIPLCNPSRASVLTGLRPDQTTVFDLDRHFRTAAPDAETLPQWFSRQGRKAARIGKLFHYDVPKGIGTPGLDDPASWAETVNPKGRDTAEEALIVNPTPQRPISAAMSWLAADGADAEQTDGMIADESVRWLERNGKKPFFLGVGFFRPHTPYVAPKKYFEMYPIDAIALPQVPADDREGRPSAAVPHNIPLPNYGLPPETLREALQAYYASTSFVDAQIGRVVEAVDRLGLADRTILVVWSDHGYHLGEHGLWQKRTLYDESARAPVIVVWPHAKTRGKTCRRVVEFIDLYPTLVDLCGGTPDASLPGRSLRPLLDDPELPWESSAVTQILRPMGERLVMGRAATTERWRYVEWNGGRDGRELYDHEQDPHERTNLEADPQYADLIERMRRMFKGRAAGEPPTTPVVKSRL